MTDRLERLINLVIALRETRVPLAASEIRDRVAGYGQPDHEAFRRMFERDKADLRALGVPVETAPVDAWGDRQGYRIDPDRYDLPELQLEADELAALAVAVEATGLGAAAGGGLRKLAVDAGDGAAVPPAAPRTGLEVGLDAPHLSVLLEAQVSRTPVRFRYAPAEGEPARRTVEPHALVHRRGRWYVVGHDRDRDARRAFRLDRILGRVRAAGEPASFDPPGEAPGPADVVPRPDAEDLTAEVVADDEVAWQVARRARGAGRPLPGGRTAYRVAVADPEAFVSWALGWGPALEVRAPAELRAAVVRRLRALAGGPA